MRQFYGILSPTAGIVTHSQSSFVSKKKIVDVAWSQQWEIVCTTAHLNRRTEKRGGGKNAKNCLLFSGTCPRAKVLVNGS